MKILHSIDTYLPGTQNWVYPQITAVPRCEGSVFTARLSGADKFALPKGRLFVWPPPWNSWWGAARLTNICLRRTNFKCGYCPRRVRRWRPDIMHAHFGTRAYDTLRLWECLNVPLVVSFYGYDAWKMPEVEPEWRKRLVKVFEKSSYVLVEGPAMAKRLVELGCRPDKVKVQRIGVDLPSLPYTERLLEQDMRIVMVGRFVEKKGFNDGLEACAEARRRGVSLSVTIVGDASEDATEQQIKQQLFAIADTPELKGRVRFAGMASNHELRQILASQDVFLCPSRQAMDGDAEGGSPVALTEAMAQGMLCVATRHCDIPEVVVHLETGLLADERDVAGLAEALSLASANRELAKRLARHGRQHVERNFDLAKQLEALEGVYDLACDRSRSVKV